MEHRKRKARNRPSLAATLTSSFLVFGALAIFSTSSLQLVSAAQAQRRAVANEYRAIAQDAARSVSAYIEDKIDTLAAAAWMTNPYASGAERKKADLASLLGLQPSFRELLLLDAGGKAEAHASRLSGQRELLSRMDGEALARARGEGSYIGSVYIDPVSSEPMAIIAIPMFDALKDYRGTLAAELNLSFMWDLVSALEVGERGYAYVVDRQGALIASVDTARVLRGENVGGLRSVAAFMEDDSASGASAAPYRGMNGQNVVGAYVPLGTPDWAVVTEIPWTDAYREVIRLFIVTAAITLGVAGLASLSGAFIARRLAVPLANLSGTAARIAGGERDLQAAVGGPSEVAGLAAAFNSMTAQLRASLEDLERKYDEVKRAEAFLRESEERFRSLIETTSDWVWETDRNGVYTYASPRVADVLGYRPDEIVGKSLFDLMPRDEAAAAMEDFRNVSEAGSPFLRREYGKLRKDGSSIVAESSGAPAFREDGSLRGYRGVDRDITDIKKAQEEQKRLQEQLQQATKMEAIGQLAGGVAHDFNNLLTVIIGNVDLARISLDPANEAMVFFDPIVAAAESAAGLTRQLLAFARRQLIQPKILCLNELVDKFRKAFIRLLGEDIALKTKLDGKLGNVRVDPGQIEQILVNLATNARAAMPTGGELFIETSNVALDDEYCARHAEARPGEYALLAVSDTGEGMSEEVKSHIFEPFFTTKPIGHGTGLGLATVFGIVKQSRGVIEVYSEEGRGTQFKIFFPVVRETPDELGSDKRDAELPTGTQTIVVAEDNEGVRKSTVRALETLRYTVISPATIDGILELAALRREPIDLLITDVVMPRMNGPELASRICSLHPETKVLFTSGYTYNVIAHHGIVRDGLNFLTKPYTIRALAEKIKQVLSS